MDEIAKNMIPNANSAERNPKAQCDIHKEKYGSCEYFDTEIYGNATACGTHIYEKHCTCIIYNKKCDGKKPDKR
jgi:hypothetical protein